MTMKMLGVRVPAGSNVPDRLKARSLETRMSYYELIGQWLDRDEREKTAGVDTIGFSAAAATQPQGGTWVEERLAEWADTIEAKLTAVIDERLSQALKAQGVNEPQEHQELQAEEPDSAQQRALKRIEELIAEGMTTRKIAEVLNEEGIPTISGGKVWIQTFVKNLLTHSTPK
jgi:hypothetical protein